MASAVSQEYIESLVMFGSLPNTDAVANPSGTNLETLQTTWVGLFAQVQTGQGAVVTSFAVPGNSVTSRTPLTVADQLYAYSQAIDILQGNRATVTFNRFF